MSRALPALILRLLASRVTLAGLRFFTACAERLVPAAQPDPAALDADEEAMFSDDLACGHVGVVGVPRNQAIKVTQTCLRQAHHSGKHCNMLNGADRLFWGNS